MGVGATKNTSSTVGRADATPSSASAPVPLYLDRAQLRLFLGLGKQEIERAFRELAVYRASERRVRLKRDDVIDWMETHRQEAAA